MYAVNLAIVSVRERIAAWFSNCVLLLTGLRRISRRAELPRLPIAVDAVL
jgi:hypothetical protein